MPINHAKEFLKSIHTEALFLKCFFKTLSSYFRVVKHFFKKMFGSNHYKWLKLKQVRCARKTDNLKSTLLFVYIYHFFHKTP